LSQVARAHTLVKEPQLAAQRLCLLPVLQLVGHLGQQVRNGKASSDKRARNY